MKLGKKAGLIVIVVILVAALAVLFTIYFRQVAERNELNKRLDRAQTLLAGLTANKQALQNNLSQAESLLEATGAQFPESVESIEYGEYLFEIAAECNVYLTSLTFPKPAAKKIGAVTYSVVSLSLPVSGTRANIFQFIDTIRTDDRFACADVKTVNMDVAGSKATINLDIYGYRR